MQDEALSWQTGVWNKISDIYRREIDERFAPVVAYTLERAELRAGNRVLDIGTGTGALALEAASQVGKSGGVTGIDISLDMLEIARGRAQSAGLPNVTFDEARAESIPASDGEFDVICSSLCFQYVIDRVAAAAECARVLKSGGRLVAAVWGGPDDTDIVRFQATAGRFAPPPPVPGVGPGALADPTSLVVQLRNAGIQASVEKKLTTFEFSNFDAAWETLAGVTTASLSPERVAEAQAAVRELMWPDPAEPRAFSNNTQFIIGVRD